MVSAELVELLRGLLFDTVRSIPTLVGTLLILLVGWVLGRVAGRLVLEILKRLKADNYFKFGKTVKVSSIVALLVTWIIYLAFIGTAVEFLNIITLSLFFGSLMTLLSKLLGGMAILVVGYLVAGYVQKKVMESNTHYSELLSQAIFFFTLVITISMAFEVVGVSTDLLNGIVLLLVAGIALGIAIALGLGLKDSVAKATNKYLK